MLARLKPLLEDAECSENRANMKFDRLVFQQRGIANAPVKDTMLVSYVLDAGRTDHGMDVLSEKYFGHKPIQFGEVAGSGRTFIGFARVAIDKATEYSAEDADVTMRLWRVLKPRLPAEHMSAVYETLERPMIEVLARMEARGDHDRPRHPSRLSGEFAQDMARLEAAIFELAGESSILARQSSSATFCLARWASPAPGRPRPARGRRQPACSTISPSKAMNSPRAFSSRASSRS